MHRAPHAQAKPGKNNPDPVRKEARGVGVKLHIQLGTRLLRVELGVSPGRGLLCALVSPHRAPCCFLGSSMPGAGLENQLLGQACLFSIPQGFFFPSILAEQLGSSAGFGHDWISAGASRAHTDPPRAAALKLPAQSLGVSWKQRENTNTLPAKMWLFAAAGSCFKKEERPLPCNMSTAPIRDISQELRGD